MAMFRVMISVISAVGFGRPIAVFRTSSKCFISRHTAGLQGVDSVLHDAAPSLLGPALAAVVTPSVEEVARWPWQPEAHGLVIDAVHDILTELDIYLPLIRKLLEGGVRVSWAIVCGACIGEAEDDAPFGSDGEVDQRLLDAELEGRTRTSVRLQRMKIPWIS